MKKRNKRKLKPIFKRALIYIFVFIAVAIYGVKESIGIYKDYQYQKTDEYKLIQVGYDKETAKYLLNTVDSETITYLLNNEYDEIYYTFITSKYFLNKNFQEYINYYKLNSDEDIKTIIALVNTHASSGWYNKEYETDTSQGDLILVNKFYYLTQDYQRDDMVSAQLSYSYSDNQASEKVLLAFKEMRTDVEEALGVRLMINSSYRSYEEQQEIYEEYKKISVKYADSYAARPGHSEHQTGLAIDLTSLEHPSAKSFAESEEYQWLIDNCYKYGFILRYPEGKDNITGYTTESWHFRYVGKDVAKVIHDEDITYDEYYAYYIEGNN